MIYHGTLGVLTISEFVILPRTTDITTSDTLTIKEQSSNKSLIVGISGVVYDSNNILTISFLLAVPSVGQPSNTLDEGNFYEIELTKNLTNAVLWRGVMFVSDQVKQDYTINDDEFKEKTSNNDYIILD